MDTEGDITTVEGVEVRRVKPGIYVREDEWQGYLEFNEVRTASYHQLHVPLLTQQQPLSLSYMREHEPFDELPLPYFPCPERGHSPPTFIFGFPISRDCSDFCRIALEKNLASPEDCENRSKFLRIMNSVIVHLNEICGLRMGNHIVEAGVFSLKTNIVLELKTNYRQLIPEDKMDDVIRVLKEYLPGTEPQWYLEADIDLNPIHAIPSRFSVKFEEGVTIWLTCARQSPCSSGASHQVSR